MGIYDCIAICITGTSFVGYFGTLAYLSFHIEINDAWDSRRRKWALEYLNRDERNGSFSELYARSKIREGSRKEEIQSLRAELATVQIGVGDLRGQVNTLFSLLKNQGFDLGKGLQCPPPNEHFRPKKRDVSKFDRFH